MTYGYRYNVKKMDSGALAITLPAFPEIISVIFPEDDIAEEAQITLIHAVNNLLEFGFAVPEAEKINDENENYVQVAPYALLLRPPQKLIFAYEGPINQGVLENLVQEVLPKISISHSEQSRSALIMDVIETCQDIVEKVINYHAPLNDVNIRIEILKSGDGAYATTEIKAAPKKFVQIITDRGKDGDDEQLLPSSHPEAEPEIIWDKGRNSANIFYFHGKKAA